MSTETTTGTNAHVPVHDLDEQAGQPTPFSTPGRWTIRTVDGSETTGYLPDWAEDDPSEVHVPLDLLPLRLAQVEHRTFFDGQVVDLAMPSPGSIAEEEVVFGGSIDCTPYAADPQLRLPVVNIQVGPQCWITGLDPDREQNGEIVVFDPTRVVAGIGLSDDPILHYRAKAYTESVNRRVD